MNTSRRRDAGGDEAPRSTSPSRRGSGGSARERVAPTASAPQPRRPRVLLLITLAEMGGAQSYVAELLPALVRDFDVAVAAYGPGPLREAAAANGVRFIPLQHVRRPISPLRDLAGLVELIRLLRRERPDILHASSSKAGVLGRLAAQLAGVPIRIFTVHGWAFSAHSGAASTFYYWADRLMRPLTTVTICVSDHARTRGSRGGHVHRGADDGDPERGRHPARARGPQRSGPAGPRRRRPAEGAEGLPDARPRVSRCSRPARSMRTSSARGRTAPSWSPRSAGSGSPTAFTFSASGGTSPSCWPAPTSSSSRAPPRACRFRCWRRWPRACRSSDPGSAVSPSSSSTARPGSSSSRATRTSSPPRSGAWSPTTELRRRLGEAGRRRAQGRFALDTFRRAHVELYSRELARRGLPVPAPAP